MGSRLDGLGEGESAVNSELENGSGQGLTPQGQVGCVDTCLSLSGQSRGGRCDGQEKHLE